MGRPLDNLMSRRFGRLLVVGGPAPRGNGVDWTCVCDCSAIKTVSGSNLRAGETLSCGCLNRELRAQRNTTHGASKSPEYNVWLAMRRRCRSESDVKYADYGGRGIKVCARWAESFEKFLADMGPRPSAKHEIDRRDNDGNYEPGNCRWATRTQQNRNTRRTHFVTLNGERMAMSECAERLGVTRGTIEHALKRSA